MALRLLVRLEPNEPALDDLVPNLLADPRPRVALAAAVATPPPSDAAVATMRRVLRAELPALSGDERYAFRNDVLAELRKHGSASKAAVPEIVALVEAHSSEAAAFETLALIGEAEAPAMERALEFLKSTTLSVRRNYALKMLKVVGPHGEEYLDEVIDVLRTHRMSDSRLTAAIMLGNLGPRAAEAAEALLEAAENDAKERVRRRVHGRPFEDRTERPTGRTSSRAREVGASSPSEVESLTLSRPLTIVATMIGLPSMSASRCSASVSTGICAYIMTIPEANQMTKRSPSASPSHR